MVINLEWPRIALYIDDTYKWGPIVATIVLLGVRAHLLLRRAAAQGRGARGAPRRGCGGRLICAGWAGVPVHPVAPHGRSATRTRPARRQGDPGRHRARRASPSCSACSASSRSGLVGGMAAVVGLVVQANAIVAWLAGPALDAGAASRARARCRGRASRSRWAPTPRSARRRRSCAPCSPRCSSTIVLGMTIAARRQA